jgi:hypothetical protein
MRRNKGSPAQGAFLGQRVALRAQNMLMTANIHGAGQTV